MISIIIPMFNAESYIEKCLQSILNQTYELFEALIIDDGSTDSSILKCKPFLERDSRFRLISKSNGGVSSARNVGIENATGEYITFIDADDYIEPEFLEHLYNSIIQTHSEIAICGYNRIYRDHSKRILLGNDLLCDYDLLFAEILNAQSMACCVWNKMFLLDIIMKNEIRFDANFKIGEDLKFCIDYIFHIKQGIYINESLYNYYILSTSAMRQTKEGNAFDIKLYSEWDAVLYCEERYKNRIADSKMIPNSILEKKMSIALKLLALMNYFNCKKNEYSRQFVYTIKQNMVKTIRMKSIPKKRIINGLIAYLKYRKE